MNGHDLIRRSIDRILSLRMKKIWMIALAATLTACDRADSSGEKTEEGETPLKEMGDEVKKILNGDRVPDEVEPVSDPGGRPKIPVAKPVPDKPGFVISPHNGKWIDVSGIAPGELVADPHFDDGEKKYFRVPESAAPKAESSEDEETGV